ncbi:MAG: cytidylyltransferase [Flavobacterium sp.]|nr:cytidylyltransferase [Flavobacterium sp.]
MIYALMLGRGGSIGFPGKNSKIVLGRPLMSYPILASQNSKYIDDIFVSTDSKEIRDIAEKYGAKYIERPQELATKESLGEDAFKHGYFWIKQNINIHIEFMVLLFCNAPTVLPNLIDQAIEKLRKNPELDSAVSVSCYNMWSPLRARKINSEGLLEPFVPLDILGAKDVLSCDRDSQGDVWYADCSFAVVRPQNLENLKDGLLPHRWMGKKIFPIKMEGGLDVDFEYQFPLVEYWLKHYAKY